MTNARRNDNQAFAAIAGAVECLNGQWWHDSVLYEIRFIRESSTDEVVFLLNLLDNEALQLSQRTEIRFHNCWLIKAKMNGGVKCISDGEMISGAEARTS